MNAKPDLYGATFEGPIKDYCIVNDYIRSIEYAGERLSNRWWRCHPRFSGTQYKIEFETDDLEIDDIELWISSIYDYTVELWNVWETVKRRIHKKDRTPESMVEIEYKRLIKEKYDL